MATAKQKEAAKQNVKKAQAAAIEDDRMPGQNHEQEFSGRDARQGEIMLRKRWGRVVFIAGLAGIAIIAIVLGWSA